MEEGQTVNGKKGEKKGGREEKENGNKKKVEQEEMTRKTKENKVKE